MNLDLKAVVEIITLAFLILGSAWRLSSQLSSIGGKVTSLTDKLDAHIKADDARFGEVDATLDAIAPRVVRLERRNH